VVLVVAHVTLTGAVGGPDLNAAVLGAEREHLEDVLEARQLGGQRDTDGMSPCPLPVAADVPNDHHV